MVSERWLNWLILCLQVPASHLGNILCSDGPTSHPDPCLWPEKAGEDSPKALGLYITWETRSSWLLDSGEFRSRCCSHLRGEPAGRRSLSLCICLSNLKIDLKKQQEYRMGEKAIYQVELGLIFKCPSLGRKYTLITKQTTTRT